MVELLFLSYFQDDTCVSELNIGKQNDLKKKKEKKEGKREREKKGNKGEKNVGDEKVLEVK